MFLFILYVKKFTFNVNIKKSQNTINIKILLIEVSEINLLITKDKTLKHKKFM